MPKGTLQTEYEKLKMDNLDLKERIEGLEAADAWRKSATEFYENGGCPLCFSTDEAGCDEGCYFGQLQLENEKYKIALRAISKESGNINRDEWPTQQQKCFAIAQQALKGK